VRRSCISTPNAAQGPAGVYLIGGTSEATPEFSGIIAIADQLAGRGLGLINPALYAMEAAHAPGIVDVTIGTTPSLSRKAVQRIGPWIQRRRRL